MLILYDVNHNKIALLQNVKDPKRERTLDGDEVLSFLYPISDTKYSLIQEECYVRTKDNEYVIKEVNEGEDWGEFVAKINVEALKGKDIEHFEAVEQTCANAVNLAIVGTGWTIGSCDVTKNRTVRKQRCSAWDVLQEIRNTYKCDFRFDAVNKKIYIYQSIGTDKGIYFTDQLNLKKLDVQRNSYDYVTRLIPIGKDGLTIESVNGGLNYIENYQYSSKVITAYWEDNRYTNPESLKEDAILRLNELSKPRQAYKADVFDLASISDKYSFLDYDLGDIITLVDETKGIKDKQRIVKIIEYLDEPEKNQIEIANRVISLDDLQVNLIETSETVDSITTTDGQVVGSKIDSVDYAKIKNVSIGTTDIQDAAITSAKIGNAQITTAHITDAAINNAKIADASISTAKIQDAAINNAKIAIAAIDTANIKDGAITNAKIANAAIDNAKIASLAVGTANIQDSAITNAKIANLAVDNAKIANATITGAKIANATIGTANIIDGAITNAKIANASIDNAKIADASISTAKIQTGAITTALIGTGAVGTAQIADGSITDAKIVNLNANKINAGTINTGQVTIQGANGKLKISNNRLQVFDNQQTPVERVSIGDVNNDGTVYGLRVRSADGQTVLYDHNGVYSEGITDGAITNPKIANDAVDSRVIAANSVMAEHIVAGAITGDKIAARTITANEIATNAITAGSAIIADGAITTAKIADGNITNAKIANATITGAKIATATIDTANIKDSSITDAKIVNLTANKLTAGTIDASQINVINLNANNITTGYLTADRIQGGILTLGGQNNQSGVLLMKDATGQIYGGIDATGIAMSKPLIVSGSYEYYQGDYGYFDNYFYGNYGYNSITLYDGLPNPGGEWWDKKFSYNLDTGGLYMKQFHEGGLTEDWVNHECYIGACPTINDDDRKNGMTYFRHGKHGLKIIPIDIDSKTIDDYTLYPRKSIVIEDYTQPRILLQARNNYEGYGAQISFNGSDNQAVRIRFNEFNSTRTPYGLHIEKDPILNTQTGKAYLSVEGDIICGNNLEVGDNIDAGSVTASPFYLKNSVGNNYISTGNGDGASYTTHNMIIRSWWGIGIHDNNDVCNIVINSRTGDISNKGKIYSNWGYSNIGKSPAYTWSGTINYNTYVTITHNLGYNPIIQTSGSQGNLVLTFLNSDSNNTRVYNYNGAYNNWTGTIYFW